jgi:hypothetical protein
VVGSDTKKLRGRTMDLCLLRAGRDGRKRAHRAKGAQYPGSPACLEVEQPNDGISQSRPIIEACLTT